MNITPLDIDDCNSIVCRECEYYDKSYKPERYLTMNFLCQQRQKFLQERRERVLKGRC